MMMSWVHQTEERNFLARSYLESTFPFKRSASRDPTKFLFPRRYHIIIFHPCQPIELLLRSPNERSKSTPHLSKVFGHALNIVEPQFSYQLFSIPGPSCAH